MKFRLLLLLCTALISCAQPERADSDRCEVIGVSHNSDIPEKIDTATPPDGTQVMRVLLKNQSFPLRGTGCSSNSNDRSTLQDLLAMTLGAGIGIGADRQVIISGGCKAEQFELQSGSTLDGWRCNLNMEEQFIKEGEYVYNSSITFGLRKDTWEFITDSITPNPLICMP